MATAGDDDHSSRKLKFLCSFGGSIAPRPRDGALRYAGGETRLIAVRDNASFSDFTAKMTETFGGAVVIKYQLPDGDLDALVTVSCPEDLENMMEEYYRFASDGSSKLRVFLFSPAESSSTAPVSIPESGPISGSGSGYLGVSPPRKVGVPVTTVGGGLGVGSVPVATAGPVAVYPHFDSHPQGFSHVAYVQNPELMQYANSTQLGVGTAPVGLVAVAPNQPVYVTEFGVSAAPRPVGMVGSVQTMDDPKFRNLPHPSQLIYNSERHSGGMDAYVGHGDVSSSQQYSMRPDESSMWQTNLPHAHSDTVVHGVNSGVPKTTSEFHSLHNGSVMIGHDSHKIVATTSGNYVMTPPMTSLAYSRVDQANDVDSVVFPGCGRSEGRSSAGAEDSPRNSQSYYEMNPNQQGHYQENHTPRIAPGQRSLVPDLLTSSHHIADGTSARDGMFQTFEPISQSNKNEFSNYDNRAKLSEGMMQNLNLNHHGTSGLNEQWSKNPQISVSSNNSGASPRNLPNPLEQLASTTVQTSILHNIPSGESSQPSFFGNFGADPHFGVSGPPMPERLLGTHPNNLKLPDGDRKIQLSQDKSGSDIGSVYSRPVGNLPLSNIQGSQPNTNVVAQNSTLSDSLFSDKDPWSIIQNSQMPVKSQEVANTESLFPGDAVNENALKSNPDVDILRGGDSYLKHNSDLQSVPSPKVSADERLKQELKATAEGVAASVLPSSHNSFETNELTKELRKSKETYSNDAGLQKHMLSEGNKSEGITAKLGDLSLGFKIPEDIGHLQIIKNSDLEEIRELGSGTFGTVYYGMWRGSDVAIKRINDRCFSGKPSEQERMRADFWNEACKLADLHHPNVVAFYGIVLDGPGGSIAIVTEFMANGSLRNALQKNDKILDPRKRLLLAMDVAFGMEYLHGKKIVHFDMKSDNLLVNLRDSQRPICKVGDLGLSKVKQNTLISGGVQGTLPWMAPELLNGSSNLVSAKVDVFSFGIVMWELLTGKEPYEDLHYGAIIGGIVNNTLRPPIPEFGEPAWKSLMERCWATDPSERPSFTEIVEQLRAMAASNSHKGQVPAQTTTGSSSRHAS